MRRTVKTLMRLFAPVRLNNRVWQRHSALLKQAAMQHAKYGA